MNDVVIVGAGIVGCAAAWSLARRGQSPLVLERGSFGEHAASWAAAGILGAQLERHAHPSMLEICVASRERYVDWIGDIEQHSGIAVGYRRCGTLRVCCDDEGRDLLEREVDSHRAAGLEAELLDAEALRVLEPSLGPQVLAGSSFPRDGVVDPPRLLEALRLAAERSGARFLEGAEVASLSVDGGELRGVTLGDGEQIESPRVVLAGGSWTTLIEGLGDIGLPAETVFPVRGQMLELQAEPGLLRRVVDGPSAYLSPREDGRVLVGATVERVGHARAVTAGGLQRLLAGAIELVPALAEATVTDSWCGFRACCEDRLPVLSRGPISGLVVATGHFRNGVVLGPLTGEVVAALVTDDDPPVDIAPFALSRLLA